MGKFWEKANVIINGLMLVALIVGSVIGYFAVKEYHNANIVSAGKAVIEMDTDASKALADKPYLAAILAQPSGKTDPIIASHEMINLFLVKEGKNPLKPLDWKDISDLYGKLYESNDFNNPTKARLREAVNFAEIYLYLLVDAHIAFKLHMLRKEDYDLWTPYIDQLGFNPAFLLAVYEGHKYGYISKDFAKELQSRLRKRNATEQFLKAIYKDMTDEKWAERVGEGSSR